MATSMGADDDIYVQNTLREVRERIRRMRQDCGDYDQGSQPQAQPAPHPRPPLLVQPHPPPHEQQHTQPPLRQEAQSGPQSLDHGHVMPQQPRMQQQQYPHIATGAHPLGQLQPWAQPQPAPHPQSQLVPYPQPVRYTNGMAQPMQQHFYPNGHPQPQPAMHRPPSMPSASLPVPAQQRGLQGASGGFARLDELAMMAPPVQSHPVAGYMPVPAAVSPMPVGFGAPAIGMSARAAPAPAPSPAPAPAWARRWLAAPKW